MPGMTEASSTPARRSVIVASAFAREEKFDIETEEESQFLNSVSISTADPHAIRSDAALIEHALRLTPAFAAWPAPALGRLLSVSKLGRHRRGEIISADEGEDCTSMIVSGYAMVGWMPVGGKRAAIAPCGPGHVVGFTRSAGEESSDGFPVGHHFRALDEITIVQMPTSLIQQILDEEPALWKDMAKMLIVQHRETLDALLTQGIGPFQHRLLATLERLALRHGSRGARGDEISLRMRLTQEDLAALLQVTRQSVNKELGVLAEAGVIAQRHNSITVIDLQALHRLAGRTVQPTLRSTET